MLINEMPMKNSQSNIHISPTKNFKTNKSPFLTSQKEKKHKLYPKKNTLKSIISNNINNNYNTLFNRKKDPNLIFTPTKKSSKIKTQINTKKTLILDIDETLVHSGFTPQNRTPDITLNLKLNGFNRTVYVFKRPYVDQFLQEMSNIFEIVTFTASLSQYAGPLLDELDKFHTVSHRLFRENCISQKGIFIKDLRKIGKELKNIIIIDNNPMSYITNIDNGIPILTWYDNSNDDELMKLIPVLKYLANVDDVRPIIKKIVDRRNNKIDFNIVNKIIKGNNNDKNNDNDNNKLNIIYGYNNNPPMNTENKEFDYKVISKNIRNSLSNMSYIDYVKNIDNQKNDNNSFNKIENKEVTNEDKKTNENIKINIYLKNDKTEDNSLKKNKIVNIKNALNSNKNYNKMSYNINQNINKNKNNMKYKKTKKIINIMINSDNNITKSINSKQILNITTINANKKINLNINNIKENEIINKKENNENNNNKTFNFDKNINNYNQNVKSVKYSDFRNNNKISFNNYYIDNISKSTFLNINLSILKNFPEDNSKQNKKNKIYHPYNSGSPHDSKNKKALNTFQLIKINTNRNKDKCNTLYNTFKHNIIQSTKNSLLNNITVNNVNFNNEMIINKIGRNKTLEKGTKDIYLKNQRKSEDLNINIEQNFMKNSNKIIEANKNKENDLKLNQIGNNMHIDDKNVNKNENSKINNIIVNNINNNKMNNANKADKNNKKLENKKKIKKINNIRINSQIINKKINLLKNTNIDNNNFNEYINKTNRSNEFMYPEKKNTNEIIYKYLSSSPISILTEQINGNYEKYNKPNNFVNNVNLIHYLQNNENIYNNTIDNFYQGDSISLLYRNNLINLKNYYNSNNMSNTNNNAYYSNNETYNNFSINNENSYLYNK